MFEAARELSLAGIDPKAATDPHARLSLDAVYTALLTKSNSQPYLLGATPESFSSSREPRRLSALEQLNRHARLVLLGDPGSGKSTFVNFVALCLSGQALGDANINLALLTQPLPPDENERQTRDEKPNPEPQPWNHGALIPVRVELRQFAARGLPAVGQTATAQHLWNFISADLETALLSEFANALLQELRAQGGLLLLDGLDEVPEADQRRAQIKQAVEDFAKTFPRCRILVTSRTYAYQKQDWRLPSFTDTELAPFGDAQIERFVENWYAHTSALREQSKQDAQGNAEILKRAIASNPRLRELAERPLLLTLMASLHAWRGGTLPEKRAELYAEAVDLLLEQWENPKTLFDRAGKLITNPPGLAQRLNIDRHKLRRLLDELAFNAHARQPELQGTADIPESELVAGLLNLNPETGLNPIELMNYLSQRAGLLIPHGVGVYTFPHRTFQEYLAACHLTNYKFPTQVAKLARAEPNRWREAALLAAAKAQSGADFAMWSLVERLCRHAPNENGTPEDEWGARIAGQTLVEILDVTKPFEDDAQQESFARVRAWQVTLLHSTNLSALERAGAGRALARLGDTRANVMTVEGMEFCYVPPGPFVMGDDSEDAKKHTNKTLDYGYWLARYPVTVAQWREFVERTGHNPTDDDSLRGFLNEPVVNVTWHEAAAFCKWFNETFGKHLPPRYQFVLPSEAEWEKAARGGIEILSAPLSRRVSDGLVLPTNLALEKNPSPEREYPWEGTFDSEKANTAESNINSTSTVGSFPRGASVYGIQELSGNMWEWTRSLWGEDFRSPAFKYPFDSKDRQREDLKARDQVLRVVRGGSFVSALRFARCAYRDRLNPNLTYWSLGFRVVASPFRL